MGPLVVAAPQSPQKRAPEGFWLPQVAHRQGSGDPQSPQNFLPLVFDPQRGQIIGAPFSEGGLVPGCFPLSAATHPGTLALVNAQFS